MGKGGVRPSIRNIRSFRRIIPELIRRRLQSSLANQRNIRIAREGVNRVNRRIMAGKILIDSIEAYLKTSGITGTVGKAENLGQAIGGAAGWIEDMAKWKKKMGHILLDGTAVLSSELSDEVYTNILATQLYLFHFEKIVFFWEQMMLKGKHKIYCLLDMGYPMKNGIYPVIAISTEKKILSSFQYKGRLILWKKVQGRQNFRGADNKHKIPRYPTIKQG